MEEIKNAERYSGSGEKLLNKTRLEKVVYTEGQIDLTEEIEEYVRCNKIPKLPGEAKEDGSLPQYKLREMMIQKAKDWEYEKEWRLVPRILDLER